MFLMVRIFNVIQVCSATEKTMLQNNLDQRIFKLIEF